MYVKKHIQNEDKTIKDTKNLSKKKTTKIHTKKNILKNTTKKIKQKKVTMLGSFSSSFSVSFHALLFSLTLRTKSFIRSNFKEINIINDKNDIYS